MPGTDTENIIIIDDIEVDIASLYSIKHRCVPGKCSKNKCCCSKYDICIDEVEMKRIVGYLPEAVKFVPHLDDGSGFENIFEEEEPGLFIIDAEEDGLCLFAYPDEEEKIFCSLHSTALELQLHPHKVKPRSCITWPLAVTDDAPMQLSIAEDAFSFPCNIRREKSLSLDPDIAQIVKDVFGEQFLMKLEKSDR